MRFFTEWREKHPLCKWFTYDIKVQSEYNPKIVYYSQSHVCLVHFYHQVM